MHKMEEVWPLWYKAIDALMEVDSMLGKVGGVARQSSEFTRKMDDFRAGTTRILNSANATVLALESDRER